MGWLRHVLGGIWYRWRPAPLFTKAYSQEGEDMILLRVLAHQPTGFYADVGAHHPMLYSNTYLFYRRGWSGINVDAMPGSMDAFRRARPRDQNIEAAVGSEGGVTRTFWMFNEPLLNTFDVALAHSRVGGPFNHAITGTREIPMRTLREIFDSCLPAETPLDFLSVDVEGLDLEVLQSNDWTRYRPRFVLTECYDVPFDELAEDPVYRFLAGIGYGPFAKTVHTVIFIDRSGES